MRDLLDILEEAADCRRRRVAAIVVRGEEDIVGAGYNRIPGELSCEMGACPRGRLSYEELPHLQGGYGNCLSIHAEEMAIFEAGEAASGATIHVTAQPCPDCDRIIREANIRAVIVWTGSIRGEEVVLH